MRCHELSPTMTHTESGAPARRTAHREELGPRQPKGREQRPLQSPDCPAQPLLLWCPASPSLPGRMRASGAGQDHHAGHIPAEA